MILITNAHSSPLPISFSLSLNAPNHYMTIYAAKYYTIHGTKYERLKLLEDSNFDKPQRVQRSISLLHVWKCCSNTHWILQCFSSHLNKSMAHKTINKTDIGISRTGRTINNFARMKKISCFFCMSNQRLNRTSQSMKWKKLM